jgi:hypothetical protein
MSLSSLLFTTHNPSTQPLAGRPSPNSLRNSNLQTAEGLVKENYRKGGSATRTLPRARQNDLAASLLLLITFSLITFLIHLPAVWRYGFFRDELYYIACAKQPAWGYVDQPPLSIAILKLTMGLLGSSLFAIRLPVLIAASLTVFFAGLITREVGGGRFAQALAAVAVMVSPVYLVVQHFFSMNGFDVLLWTLAVYLFVRVLKRDSLKLWLLLGLVLGLGLLNKLSVLWLCLGLFVGLLLTPNRKMLAKPGPWLATLVIACFFTPFIFWQATNGWPTREFIHNATTQKMIDVPILQFFFTQFLAMNPATAPIWIIGLFYALFFKGGREWRVLSLTFLTVLAILLVNGRSRANYLSPAYPMLIAMGAVAIERHLLTKRGGWGRGAALSALALSCLVLLPVALPLLPVDTLVRYTNFLGISQPQEEQGKSSLLPEHLADMFGWPELTSRVAAAYDNLSPGDRAKCAILTSNYGEAAAIDYYGKGYGLPKAISAHNNYWLWGPRGWTGEVAIVVNRVSDKEWEAFSSIRQVDTVNCKYCVSEQQETPLYVAKSLKMPVAEFWNMIKKYR